MNTYETHHIKDPRLPFIFHASTVYPPNKRDVHGNWHENIEVLLVTAGKGSITLNTAEHTVSAGDIIVVNTNVLHKVASSEIPLTYHCLIVDRGFCLSNCFDTNAFWFCESFRDRELERLINALALEFSRKEHETKDVVRIRAYVLEVMARLCSSHCSEKNAENMETSLLKALKRAIGFIRSDFSRDISLDEAAEFAGLSKYYFAREFHRITGYTFVEYVNILRCEKAQQMLIKQGMTVAEIAAACGFENRAYFTRTFKKYVGSSPSECRRH